MWGDGMIRLGTHDILRYAWTKYADLGDIFTIAAKDKIFYAAPAAIYSAIIRDLFFETRPGLYRLKLAAGELQSIVVPGMTGSSLLGILRDDTRTRTAELAVASIYCLMNAATARTVIRSEEILKEVMSIYNALGDYRRVFDSKTDLIMRSIQEVGRDGDNVNMVRLGIAIRSLVLADMLKETANMDLGRLALEILHSLVNSPTPAVRDLFTYYRIYLRFRGGNKKLYYTYIYVLTSSPP